jgi:hypothetical protein
MTKAPNPNQIPRTNNQNPKKDIETFPRLGFGHWALVIPWDLGPWTLGFGALDIGI